MSIDKTTDESRLGTAEEKFKKPYDIVHSYCKSPSGDPEKQRYPAGTSKVKPTQKNQEYAADPRNNDSREDSADNEDLSFKNV